MSDCNEQYLDLIIGMLSALLFLSEYLATTKKCTCNGILHALFPNCIKDEEVDEKIFQAHIRKVLKEIELSPRAIADDNLPV
tara:strand:+ start:803 stop:1048 length:246 start_codon:yes stop_codon:yes gene_type:complete